MWDFPITYDELHEKFIYNDGMLFCRKTNKRNGSFDKSRGYFRCTINGERFKLHRIVFALHHSYVPEIVDHIDGDRTNNKIENLRPASHSQNAQNRKLYKNNTFGIKGLRYIKSGNWEVKISHNNVIIYLGVYDTLLDAAAARIKAESHYHGEFSRQQ